MSDLDRLNRFTSLPVALDILSRQQMTLLSPDTWEDRNDAYYRERYREKKNLESVLALCFSTRAETFHHWRVFAGGSSGVCIEFDPGKLLTSFPEEDGFRHRKVNYWSLDNIERNPPAVSRWPFLKRQAFGDEGEYRIVFDCADVNLRKRSVDINLRSIQKITLSPWLPKSVAESVKMVIHKIEGCRQIKVIPSTLLSNARWRRAVDERMEDLPLAS